MEYGILNNCYSYGRDTWKWVNKAVQKLIRYDLREGLEVAIVSFSNETRVEARLEPLTGMSRERIADTVPGKYQLAKSNDRNELTIHHVFLAPELYEVSCLSFCPSFSIAFSSSFCLSRASLIMLECF